MEQLIRLSARLDVVITKLGQFTAWLAIPIIAIVMVDVVTRRFFTLGSVTLQELEWHFHAVLFLFCSAYTYLNDGHVRVDIVRSRLGPIPRAWIELIGATFFLTPYSLVMVYLGSRFVVDSYELGEISDAPGGLPYRFLIKSAMPIGFFFLALSGVSTIVKQVVMLRTGQMPGAVQGEGGANVR